MFLHHVGYSIFFLDIVEEHAVLMFKVAALRCSSYLNIIIYNCMTVDFYCVVFFQLSRSLAYTGCSCCWFSDCVLPVLPVLSLLFAIQKASSWNCLWQYVIDMMKRLFVFWLKFLRPWSVFRFYIKQ